MDFRSYVIQLKNPKVLLKGSALILLVIGLPLWLFSFTGSPDFKTFVVSIGPFGPLVVIIYTIFSHVFAPVIGSPVAVLSFTMYGVPKTMYYMYVGGLFSSIINYWLAHTYGRKLVLKFSGQKTMEQIDFFAEHLGNRVLILSRFFAGGLFDVISYAAGITSMKFSDYYFITVIVSGVSTFITGYIFRNFDFTSPVIVLEWLAFLVILGGGFGIIFKKIIPYIKEHQVTKS
ncbi:hypothetical protein CO179_05540 [candidate division WWE3 bacterium CG_4_9_14_3_um_filter_39_7]|uniref:TVP38/TMEM64 family membrane protein n=1 Tax=candidate division WWE3 bacterium CG_4_9_14_3_um_filter_39_7 TaxID=1975080 RepID=A0A2M7X096_UNCKA|nr:MAG: hypothetical protein CO179_05540 [candidate division WWE3 bacterium CG_4_9_14_3_um_filter_39_7]